MKFNNSKHFIKATISSLMVALIFVIIIYITFKLIFSDLINEVVLNINSLFVLSNAQNTSKEIQIEDDKIITYPEFGQEYSRISIPSINLDLPVYFGDTLEILKKGVGHSSGSYFPGENASIVYMAHNAKNFFRNFSKLNIGDAITVTTNYGKFTYSIYETKIINETDLDQIPIQKEKELLMIYTCYPFNNIGYTTKRFVVYCNLLLKEDL